MWKYFTYATGALSLTLIILLSLSRVQLSHEQTRFAQYQQQAAKATAKAEERARQTERQSQQNVEAANDAREQANQVAARKLDDLRSQLRSNTIRLRNAAASSDRYKRMSESARDSCDASLEGYAIISEQDSINLVRLANQADAVVRKNNALIEIVKQWQSSSQADHR